MELRMEDASGTDRVRCGEIGFSESSVSGSGFRRGRKTQGEDFRPGPGLFRTLIVSRFNGGGDLVAAPAHNNPPPEQKTHKTTPPPRPLAVPAASSPA